MADIVESTGITQAEFAAKMGVTAKFLSQLIDGQISVTDDLADKLSAMTGTSVEVWLNLQNKYDEKIVEKETTHGWQSTFSSDFFEKSKLFQTTFNVILQFL